ncbi:SIMPL domain-containing protein [Streptomyces lasiicapitis]|uniref:SIMPL domain-containing protein n=1 Tax=Streptomyces lasiicapitis TaxID=1923961 RepID=UPI0033316E58
MPSTPRPPARTGDHRMPAAAFLRRPLAGSSVRPRASLRALASAVAVRPRTSLRGLAGAVAVRPRTSLRVLSAAVAVLAALGTTGALAAPVAADEAPVPGVLAPAAAPAPAAPAPAPSTVTVTGTGSASAAPDLAVVGVAVEVTAPTAEKALAAQHAAAEALLDALRRQGVAERDVRTDSLELSAVYEEGSGAAKLTGYRAAQSFSVKVRELHRTGRVIKAASDAAGDAARINGVTFDLADARPLRAKARQAAHEDARSKAEHYAGLTGRELGRLVSLSEAEAADPRPLTVSPAAFAKQDGVPVAPGEIEDKVSVVAVYELR